MTPRQQSAPGTRGTEGKALTSCSDSKVRAVQIQATSNPTVAPVEYIEGKIEAEVESFNLKIREGLEHAAELEELLEEIRASQFEERGAEQ